MIDEHDVISEFSLSSKILEIGDIFLRAIFSDSIKMIEGFLG